MRTVKEGQLGKFTLRIVDTPNGLQGVAIKDAAFQTAVMAGQDIDELWERLVQEVGSQSAEYVGFDGAISRFLSIFPAGFSDTRYLSMERDYKIAAIERLNNDAPLEMALEGKARPELIAKATTNLLYKSEAITFRDILLSPRGREFVTAAAKMATGDVSAGLSTMTAVANAVDRKSWPLVTYLPFLWKPDDHMFLKPTIATGFAERVGHRLAHDYSSDIEPAVYGCLIDLTKKTHSAIEKLKPADNIDVQSFIWAVAKYTADDVSAA